MERLGYSAILYLIRLLTGLYFQIKRDPLVVTRSLTDNASRWWTSIPEGRQREAEEIGPFITAYIKANQL